MADITKVNLTITKCEVQFVSEPLGESKREANLLMGTKILRGR